MKQNGTTLFGTFALALVVASTAYGQTRLEVARKAETGFQDLTLHQTAIKPGGSLTKSEIEGLLFMREEEKLALAIYVLFAKKWGSRPFGNISQAEQSHMNSVKVLLDKYGLADPAATLKPGQFKDKTLQKLYDDLVKSGSSSRIEAFKVGATIEDVDLYDLARWAKLTDKQDILSMYDVLSAGSRNHMRAFVRNLRNSGFSYKPKYISQGEFDKIISPNGERVASLVSVASVGPKISSSSTFHAVTVPLPLNRVAFFLGQEAVIAGFKVTAQHDLQASLAKEGRSVNPTLVVELCQPDVAFRALTGLPAFASAMPCRIALTEVGGETTMSMILPTALDQAITDRTGAQALAKSIQEDLMAIVERTSRRQPSLDQAWFDVNLPYKAALYATNNGEAKQAEMALRRSVVQWKALSERFSIEVSNATSKEQWTALTNKVRKAFDHGLVHINSGELKSAHESLEAIRGD